MKLSTSLTFIICLFLLQFAGAQELVDPIDSTSSSLSINSVLDVDKLLVIEDASPELSIDGRKPLLLVHGWNFDGKPAQPGGSYWTNFVNYIKNDATLRANFKPYLVKYWSNYVSVAEIGKEFKNQVEALGLHEQKIVIVGHSMGGLVSRSYMNEQKFTKGVSAGKKCGDNVDLLITLSSPHHGSPMANGPARNAKVSLLLQATMSTVDALVFKETKYDDVNRTDLHWDNFDGLFDYNKYSDERNLWLEQLNKNTVYDSRTICYSGSVDGQFLIPDAGNLDEVYALGAWFMEQGFNFTNDGIVPIQSSQFQGHIVKRIRYFKGYNHYNIIAGKSDQGELFNPLKTDLLDVIPLKITWPSIAGNYIKHSQYRNIEWNTSSTIKHVNIYFSSDNGTSYSLIASNVDASTKKYSWYIPDINSPQCLIRIEDSDFPNTFSVSSNTFTIFHNKITLAASPDPGYFVRYKQNTIVWTQEGLGNKAKLIYVDAQNDIEKTITEEISTQKGSNSYVWAGDETLPPTTKAQLKIQLRNLYEDYGDSEIYTFISKNFQMLGDPGFTVLSPETSPVDYFGIEGEQVLIGRDFNIKWKAEGEIKYIELYLCDKNKQIIKKLSSESNSPKVEITSYTRTQIPEIYGNEFYVLGRAGFSPESDLLESYSEKSFRINRKVNIVLPARNDTLVSLQPCFEVDQMAKANLFTFYLEDTLATDQFPSWQYESATPEFCVPKQIENELQPGMVYQLTAVAITDTIQSFADQIYFRTAEVAPWNFELVTPVDEDSTQEDQIQVVWTRSVGANHYILSASQNGKTIFENTNLAPTDTAFIVPLSDIEFYSDINIEVIAVNSFGETTVSADVFKHYRTGITTQVMPDNYGLKNYPNPVVNGTTFEFTVPANNESLQVSLILYDLTGQRVASITNRNYNAGKQRIIWNPNSNELTKGNYIYRLTVDGYSVSKILQLK